MAVSSVTDSRHALLSAALDRLSDPARTPSRPFTPRPSTDRAYYADCFEQRHPELASKACTRCEVVQDAEEFRYKPDSRTETHSWCRTCEAEAQRKRNARRRGRVAA